MHIRNLLDSSDQPLISFEFFPPKTEVASDDLFGVIRDLADLKPAYVSVTYGAGGSTRDLTQNLVKRILDETKIPATPHLTCVMQSREEVSQILSHYAETGVTNILALRGDPPRDQPDYDRSGDDFPYASDLVRFLAEFNARSQERGFGIGVAGFPEGHPETPNRMLEMDYLKTKVDCGADYICTQLFFDNHDFFDYRDRCELAGVQVPIIAGVMPVTSRKGMVRMASLAAGARFPAKLQRLLKKADDASADDITKLGIDYAAEQCDELIREGIPGIHFYTLNKSRATLEVVRRLGRG
ncbi:MAG: methylenetetrahydrofolate reductase [NAD(P)H] [Verrucomicrobiota bacterium]